tara:strand:+ start:1666 stop:2019 length:354 start_codon:yes stop_codon:yes gene_type:complete
MPIYVYKCTKCNSKTEELQKFTDPPLTVCNVCGGFIEKQTAQRGAFHLKGSGWYKDSYHNPWGQGNNKFEDTTLDKSAIDMGWDQGQRDDIKGEVIEADELSLPSVQEQTFEKQNTT